MSGGLLEVLILGKEFFPALFKGLDLDNELFIILKEFLFVVLVLVDLPFEFKNLLFENFLLVLQLFVGGF